MKKQYLQLSRTSDSSILTLSGNIKIPKIKSVMDVQVTPTVPNEKIEVKLDIQTEEITITLKDVRMTSTDRTTYYLGLQQERTDHRLCFYSITDMPPWNDIDMIPLHESCPLSKVMVNYYFKYTVTISYEDNTAPRLELSTADSQPLSNGKLYKIYGSALDIDNGDFLTVKYKINNQQEKILLTGKSDGISPLPFTKVLTCRDGRLYDGTSSVSSLLTEGVNHTLSVWAEDDNGGKSIVATRTFMMSIPVIDKTPKPSNYTGSIPVSYNFIKAMKSPIKELSIKLEFYDSKMNYISEFSKDVTADDIGAISVDLNRPVRRTFSFSLNNQKNLFNWGEEKLIWINKRVKIYIGLKLPTGTIEYVPQGVFIISDPQDSHTLEGKRTFLVGQDKMWLMTDKRGKFLYETKIEEGLNIGTALKIIASKAGETLFNFDEIDEIVPYELTYSPNDNLYKALEELSILAKGIIYYDVFGYLRFKKIDLNAFDNSPASWIYKFDDPNERFYAGNVRKFDETNLANHIVVLGGSGQTATSSYSIVVDDENPLWKNNPYSVQEIGQITYFHNNGSPDTLLTTQEECKWRAKYELMKRLGYTERVSLNVAPVFVHDAGEIIEIEDNHNNVKGKYLLESFSVPIAPTGMTCECLKYRKVIDNWDFI